MKNKIVASSSIFWLRSFALTESLISLRKITPTSVAFIWVTSALGPSPQSTACRSATYSLATIPGLSQGLKLLRTRRITIF